jgi:hypothetical protein
LSFELGDFVSPMREPSERKARTKVHWTVQNFGAKRQSGLSLGVTPTTLHCTRHVPCIPDEEMFVSARGTSSLGRLSHRRRPRLSRVSHQNFGDARKSHKEQEDSDVQDSMEPPHKRRSTWEREEELKEEFLDFLAELSEPWGHDSIKGGVGFHSLKFKFGKKLILLFKLLTQTNVCCIHVAMHCLCIVECFSF